MVQEDNVVSAKVLRLEQVGKFEDLEYCLYSRQSMVGGEIKVQVRGKIMGLNKKIIHVCIQIENIWKETQNLINIIKWLFCGDDG